MTTCPALDGQYLGTDALCVWTGQQRHLEVYARCLLNSLDDAYT